VEVGTRQTFAAHGGTNTTSNNLITACVNETDDLRGLKTAGRHVRQAGRHLRQAGSY
jgi:hypothetical protein